MNGGLPAWVAWEVDGDLDVDVLQVVHPGALHSDQVVTVGVERELLRHHVPDGREHEATSAATGTELRRR